MQMSVAGAIVCLALLLLDRRFDGRLFVALLASMAFGATALVSLPALGGASPVIYTTFALLILAREILNRDAAHRLSSVFNLQFESWIILLLIVNTLLGAYLLPRLFLGDTIVFIVTRGEVSGNMVVAARLAPTVGNITQAAYMALDACIYIVWSMALLRGEGFRALTRGLFVWVVLVASMGCIDLVSKLAGAGDVLAPIRTANYEMMTGTDNVLAGFFRISGGFSESSAFGGTIVTCIAFTVTYWRFTRSRAVLALSAVLLVLLVFSTSSTAYMTAAIAATWLGLTIAGSMLLGRIRTTDAILLGIGFVLLTVVVGTYLVEPSLFEPIIRLIDVTIINKAGSPSAIERGMWNAQALQGLQDTHGLGVGIGSTRTSSWIVAVASHLGLVGLALMLVLVFVVLRGLAGVEKAGADPALIGVVSGLRAAAITQLVAGSLAAPSPNPGVLFFLCVAALLAVRRELGARETASNYRGAPTGNPAGAH